MEFFDHVWLYFVLAYQGCTNVEICVILAACGVIAGIFSLSLITDKPPSSARVLRVKENVFLGIFDVIVFFVLGVLSAPYLHEMKTPGEAFLGGFGMMIFLGSPAAIKKVGQIFIAGLTK